MEVIKKNTPKLILHSESEREVDEDTIDMYEADLERCANGTVELDSEYKAFIESEIKILKEKWNI